MNNRNALANGAVRADSEVAERPGQSQRGVTDEAQQGYYDNTLLLPDFINPTIPDTQSKEDSSFLNK